MAPEENMAGLRQESRTRRPSKLIEAGSTHHVATAEQHLKHGARVTVVLLRGMRVLLLVHCGRGGTALEECQDG